MAGRTIAIGDVHGCHAALVAVLKAIAPKQDDTIVMLGDYIDRGPASKLVVAEAIALGRRCRLIPLRGNHEILLLTTLANPSMMDVWRLSGGDRTVESYGGLDKIPDDHLTFLQSLLAWHETETHIFVHAGYHPRLEMDEQSDAHLYWEHLSFVLPGPHCSGKTVIVGHTPQRNGEILDCGHLICIDTFCFGAGCLTALDVDTGETWQADKEGALKRK